MVIESAEQMGRLEKSRYITIRVIEVLRSDVKFVLCLVGKSITSVILMLFSIFMILWVTSFVDSGVLESEDVSKDLCQ